MKLIPHLNTATRIGSFKIVLLALMSGMLLTGCHTKEGIEQDAESAGEAVKDAADDAGDAVKDAVDDAGDTVKDAADDVDDSIK